MSPARDRARSWHTDLEIEEVLNVDQDSTAFLPVSRVAGVRGPELGLLDAEHVEGHDLHQAVRGQRQRRLGDQRPELVQQAALRHGEVLRVNLGVQLALGR